MVPQRLMSNYCERVRTQIYTVLDRTKNRISTCTLHKDKTTSVCERLKTDPVEAEEYVYLAANFR